MDGPEKPLIDARSGEIFLTLTVRPRLTFSQFVRARASKEAPADTCQQEWHDCWLRQEWEAGRHVSANLLFHRERLDRIRLTFNDLPPDAGMKARTRE